MCGEVYPGCYAEITVTFKPNTSAETSATAYCELMGREQRLPLHLLGRGLGPRATWLYDVLDVGDVYVNATHRCPTNPHP